MARAVAFAALFLLFAGVSLGAVSNHINPSPQVHLQGASFVPGGIHFSPVRDPYEGAWHGVVTWDVGCAGAERWAWDVEFADLAAGSYRMPPEIRPRERSQSVFFYDGSGYSSTTGRSRGVTIPAGAFVFPYIKGSCYGEGHWSEQALTDGEVLHVPPYIWYPTIITRGGRQLQSTAARGVVLRKGRAVTARLRIRESAVEDETIEVRLLGAGVNIRKRYRAGQLERPVSVRFRPKKRGVVRYWVVARPYGVKSLVYGLRVR